ncbi:hypothetical protein [Microtetraspora fusca]|uniref:hypothetical protein n=1 Tax=Microtetraspora fusca TaxID=1997 RepID=UPI0012FB00C5|nr:hypothetical protein [Microtetraspora fusca]
MVTGPWRHETDFAGKIMKYRDQLSRRRGESAYAFSAEKGIGIITSADASTLAGQAAANTETAHGHLITGPQNAEFRTKPHFTKSHAKCAIRNVGKAGSCQPNRVVARPERRNVRDVRGLVTPYGVDVLANFGKPVAESAAFPALIEIRPLAHLAATATPVSGGDQASRADDERPP